MWRTFKRLAAMSRGYAWWYVLIGVMCLMASLSDIAVTDSLRRVVDSAFAHSMKARNVALLLGVGGFLGSAVFNLVVGWLTAWLDQTSVLKLQTRLVSHVHRVSQSFFDKNHSGDMITRVLDNSGAAQGGLNGNAVSLVQNILNVAALLIYLVRLSPVLTLGTVLAASAIPAALIPLSTFLNKIWGDRWKLDGEISAFVQDSVQGGEVSRAFGLLPSFLGRFDAKYRKLIEKTMKAEAWSKATTLSMITLVVAGMFFVLGYGGYLVSKGVLTAGAVAAFLVSFERLGFPISSILQTWPNLQSSLSAADRVFELLDAPLEETGWAQAPAQGASGFSDRPIVFQDVTFAYGEGKAVLKGVTFEAEPNRVTAIVGESGSGKSTIAKLLMGAYLPDSGTIALGDTPITRFCLPEWRAHIGYVTQDVYLFTGTIRENISMGNLLAGEDEVRAAAAAANCDEFVSAIPEGYDAQIGERGVKLSGGQRQRIAIARAILKFPSILLLDEATSSLDNESERYVQDALDRFSKGRTTIVIAHRLSTVMGADKIIFLEDGRVLESGSHDELMQACGRYRAMFMAAYSQEEVAV